MRFRRMKKIMAAAFAATMLMFATLMVCAEDSFSGNGSTTVSGNGTPTVSGNDLSSSDSSSTDSSTGSSISSSAGSNISSSAGSNISSSADSVVSVTPEPTYVEKMTKSANASISVAGINVKTSVSGVYAAETVRGVVVETPVADVKASLGLSEGQKPIIFIYDVDSKKSVNAMASINAAAEVLGADVVACLQIELGAKENGKWVELSDGSVALKAGLPKSADTSLTYSAICVQEGGVITVLKDLDTDPNTITFAVNAGLGAYAIVAK